MFFHFPVKLLQRLAVMIEKLVVRISEEDRIGVRHVIFLANRKVILPFLISCSFLLLGYILSCLIHKKVKDGSNIVDGFGSAMDRSKNHAEESIVLEDIFRNLIVVIVGDFSRQLTCCFP